MDPQIRAYWAERLDKGQIFYAPKLRKEGLDFRMKDGTPEWPAYVAKQSLFGDYCAWAENRAGATRPMAEVYRQLGPLLFIHGVARHSRQLKTDVPRYVGEGRMLLARVPRAFIRMASLEALRAAYSIRMGHGVASQRSEWMTVLRNSEQAFLLATAR